MVLIMTVEPGFGGQSFLDVMLPKIRRTRELIGASGQAVWLQVDGGVDETTIARCAEAGADVFVAGRLSTAATTRRPRSRLCSRQHGREPAVNTVLIVDDDPDICPGSSRSTCARGFRRQDRARRRRGDAGDPRVDARPRAARRDDARRRRDRADPPAPL